MRRAGDLVKEEVTEEASALLTVPEGVTKVQVGAASYEGEWMGRFTLQEIDLSAAVDAEVVFSQKKNCHESDHSPGHGILLRRLPRGRSGQ